MKIDMKKNIVLESLLRIKNSHPEIDTTVGICRNVELHILDSDMIAFNKEEATRYFVIIIEQACKNWEHYSGCNTYPINGLEPNTGCDTYNDCQRKNIMYEGEYGRRRLELIQRMIDIIVKGNIYE